MSKKAEDGGETLVKSGKKPRKKPRFQIFRWLVLVPLVILAGLICAASVVFVVFADCSKDLPNVEKLKYYSPSETTKIFSSDGVLLCTLFKENREWVSYSKIPKNMVEAMVAIEDSRFYEHRGISIKDIIRALYVDLTHKGIKQGASTITQQLARNIFLHPQANLRRKVREALLAMEIEKRFTKSEIMELYLNQIYFGSGSYGIQAAARTYFDKDISDLSLAQCAIIAGLPAAPSDYSPLENPHDAKYRQMLVLKRMNDLGYIDYKTMKESMHEKMTFARKKSQYNLLLHPYFTTYALHELFQKYSDDLLYRGGLRVYTTVDLRMQAQAGKALKDGLDRAEAQGLNCRQGAIVAVEPSTGFIKAMVGGTGWSDTNQFNRAWQARRQPGSSFKIFVYTTAIDSGFTPDSIVEDSPISYADGPGRSWSPKNSDGSFWGGITISRAVQFSRNVAAVRMMHRLGPEKVIQYAYRMGIKDRLEPNLSLALGSGVVTPLDMAAAISVLANEGVRVEPTAIKKIIDSEGNVIEDNTYPTREVVLPATTASDMTEILQSVISSGTGTNAQIGRPAAGKTGTTDDHRDAWFVGYTPEMACAVWTGNDDFSRMNYAFGGNIPATVWGTFMKAALEGKAIANFHKPGNDLVAVLVCDESGMKANTACPKTHREMFRKGAEPRGLCPIHAAKVDKPRETERPAVEQPPQPEVHEEDLQAPGDFQPPGDPGAPADPPPEPKAPDNPPPAPKGEVDI